MKNALTALLRRLRAKREFETLMRDVASLERMGAFVQLTASGDTFLITVFVNGVTYHWHPGTVHRFLIEHCKDRRFRKWRSRFGRTPG